MPKLTRFFTISTRTDTKRESDASSEATENNEASIKEEILGALIAELLENEEEGVYEAPKRLDPPRERAFAGIPIDTERYLKTSVDGEAMDITEALAERLYNCGPYLPLTLKAVDSPMCTILVQAEVSGEWLDIGVLSAHTTASLIGRGAFEDCPGAARALFVRLGSDYGKPYLVLQVHAPRQGYLSLLGRGSYGKFPNKFTPTKPPQNRKDINVRRNSIVLAPENPHRFVAIDVETANPDYASICQIGWVVVLNNMVVDQGSRLINPDTYFAPMNISIHGIDKDDVANASFFAEVWADLLEIIGDSPILSHGPFDETAIKKKLDQIGQAQPENIWIDNIRVIRRTWPDLFAKNGYGLADACEALGVSLTGHHHAEHDALAAARLFLRAISASGKNPVELWEQSRRKPSPKGDFCGPGTDVGPWAKETVVFTGELNIPRRNAAELAKKLGANVANAVTYETSVVVVSDTEAAVSDHDKFSSKHRKAIELIAKGSPITIMSEAEFLAAVSEVHAEPRQS